MTKNIVAGGCRDNNCAKGDKCTFLHEILPEHKDLCRKKDDEGGLDAEMIEYINSKSI